MLQATSGDLLSRSPVATRIVGKKQCRLLRIAYCLLPVEAREATFIDFHRLAVIAVGFQGQMRLGSIANRE